MEHDEPEAGACVASPDQQSDDDEAVGEEAPVFTEPQFYHFKIKHDPAFNYKEICKAFFMAEHPYLCTIEHVNKVGTHVHCQGTSILAPRTVKNRLNRIAKKHYLRKLDPGCRPTSMSARAPDVKGFQYMAKELKPAYVLAVNMFTQEELKELKEKSVMHVKELKSCVRDFIAGMDRKNIEFILKGKVTATETMPAATDTNSLIVNCTRYLLWAEEKEMIKLPEYNKHHTRNSIIRGLLANPAVPKSWKAQLYCL